MNLNTIEIRGLRLPVRLGVPEAERALRQCVEMDVTLVPLSDFEEMGDDLSRTVDYQAVSQSIRSLCDTGEWRLLEKLAIDVVGEIYNLHPVRMVTLEVRKQILPGTDHVAVRLTRGVS